jgi:hypothetical protein
MTKINICETLEAMIDQHSLLDVMTGLVCVCSEKADHLRTNWQDNASARTWDSDSVAIENLLRNIKN